MFHFIFELHLAGPPAPLRFCLDSRHLSVLLMTLARGAS
jgi:hypothetical protein